MHSESERRRKNQCLTSPPLLTDLLSNIMHINHWTIPQQLVKFYIQNLSIWKISMRKIGGPGAKPPENFLTIFTKDLKKKTEKRQLTRGLALPSWKVLVKAQSFGGVTVSVLGTFQQKKLGFWKNSTNWTKFIAINLQIYDRKQCFWWNLCKIFLIFEFYVFWKIFKISIQNMLLGVFYAAVFCLILCKISRFLCFSHL